MIQKKEIKKEAFDLQLFILLLLKKIWILFFASVIGGLLFGGIYYLQNITFGPHDTYEMVSDSHLTYALNGEGEEYQIFNQVTWESMVICDDIVFPIARETGISEEVIRDAVSGTLLSDTRILTTTVASTDKEMVEQINKSLLSSLQLFGESQIELEEIKPMTVPGEATVQMQDVRVFNATILGLVVGLLLSLFLLTMYLLLDDRIHHPGIFEERYEIPVLGIFGTKLYKENCAHLFDEEKEYVAVFVDDIETKEVEFVEGQYAALMKTPFVKPENIAKLDADNTYILFVNARRHNSKIIQETFSIFEKYQCNIEAAVLTSVDERLLKFYYFPGKKWMEKHLK